MAFSKLVQNRALGFLVLLLAIGASWIAAHRPDVGGVDAYSLHFLALGIVDGVNVYDPAVQSHAFVNSYGLGAPPGVFYPPVTAIMVAPLGLLSPRVAVGVFWAVLVLAVVLAVRQACIRLRPEANWPLLAGLLLLSACLRWGMTPEQAAPLLLGMLIAFYLSLTSGNRGLSALVAGCALGLKMTMALPFMGLLLLQRRLGTCVLLGVLWIGLNALGFYRMGGWDAWHAYTSNMSVVEALGDINTPDPWEPISIPRTDWVYLGYGITGQLLPARLFALVSVAATALYLLWKGFRVGRAAPEAATAAFLMPLTCLTLLAVYHHHYDASLVVAPLLISGLRSGKVFDFAGPGLLNLPLLGLLAVAPVGWAQAVLFNVSPMAVAAARLCFPLALTLTLLVSLRRVADVAGSTVPT